MQKKLTIFSDGGARGNPGPAAIGVIIKDENDKIVARFGEYLGEQTNNYAEYMALISGLEAALDMRTQEVICYVDSKLVAEQLNQRWKVKEPTLQKLFVKAYNLMQKFKSVKIFHTYREKNKEADQLVNKVLDQH